MMSKDNIVHICNTCKKEFPTLKSLYGHQRVHSRDKQLERHLKKTRPSYSPGEGTSNSVVLGGYSLFKNTTTFPSFSSGDTNDNMPVYRHPVAPDRNTGYGFSSRTPLVTHNHHNHPALSNFNRLGGVSFGPFKSGGGRSSSRAYPYPLFNGGTTRAPPATPYRSSSRVPLPSYRYNNSHDHSFGSVNSIGRFRNNNNNNNNNGSSQGSLSLDLSLGPSKSMGDSNNNSSSQGSLSLTLSLGPSKSMGGSNNNISSAYPSSITGGDTRNMNMPVRPRASRFYSHGRNPLDSITRNVPLSHPPPTTTTKMNMNMPVRPRVSRFHFHGRNPLDSITGNVPLPHPPPTTNMNMLVRPRTSRFHFHGRNPLDSILRNVPLSHPHPTTHLPDDTNNVSGSSLSAKEKDTIVVLDDDDEKENVVIGDHDEDHREEVEAKSCGRD